MAMSSYNEDSSHLLQCSFDAEEMLLEDLLRTPKHISLDECLASSTIADKFFNFNYENDDLPEQITNHPEADYEVPPTTNNIPFAPPMTATVDIPPATHNITDAYLPYYDPETRHTSTPFLSFNKPSSYTITPTTHNFETYYNPSSCMVPSNETETYYDPSYIDPFIETYMSETHNTPTNTQLCMAAQNAPILLNSQPPPPPSGLPMAPVYFTNQLNQLISAPRTYTSYSSDPVASIMAMNLPSCLGMDPSTFNTCSFIDTTTGFGGLDYNDGASAGFGFFADTGMSAMQSTAMDPYSLGMYSSPPIQSIYNPGDLQVLRDCNQLMAGCSTRMAPLQGAAADLSTLEESGFKVPPLTLEEKKKKISRYMEKKIARNYSKKIKYACRKTLADSRHRVRGRFAKNDEVPQAAPRPPRSVDH